jgi:hypothetical protein
MIITIVMINIANDNTNYELFLPITTDMKYHYIYHYYLVIWSPLTNHSYHDIYLYQFI